MPRKNNTSTVESPITTDDLIQSWIDAIHSGNMDLSKTQTRALKFLAVARGPVTFRRISEETGIDMAWVPVAIGYVDPDKRRANEISHRRPSLLTLGWVSTIMLPPKHGKGKESRCYRITPEGRTALKRILKEEAE